MMSWPGSWHPLVTLAPISLLAGAGMLWVFGRVSRQDAILRTRKRLTAALYELRLFADEPGLVLRAQKDLLVGNLRYLALMLKPALVLVLPMVPLLAQLDAVYGRKPLPVGRAAIVTVKMKSGFDAGSPAPVLAAPPGILVETPAVRIPAERQVSWRIRPQTEMCGNLRIVFPDATVEKSIVAGAGLRYLSGRRVNSVLGQFWHAGEKRLAGTAAEWIEVGYPPAEVALWGLSFHWLVWFFVLSLASAWFLRKRFGVTI